MAVKSIIKSNFPMGSIGLVLLGGLILGFQDSLVKATSSYTSFWQLQAIRSFFNLLLIFIFALTFTSIRSIIPKRPFYVILRSIFIAACMLCFFSGSVTLDFTLMTAGLYTYPIFITIMAIPFLGERLNSNRILGIILGIIGSIFILEPWNADISYVQILPICAGFLYACNIITIKKFCEEETPISLAAIQALFFILIGISGILFSDQIFSESVKKDLPFIAVGWPDLTVFILCICALASICNLSGNIFIIKGYQTSDGSLLAPFDFAYLIFAVFWGKIVLGTWPDFFDAIGVSLILLAGIISSLEAFTFKSNKGSI